MFFSRIILFSLIYGFLPHTAQAADLTDAQIKELTVFSGRSMGVNIQSSDIKNIVSRAELNKLVATGININGHLCAEIVDIRPLKISSTYEVTCIAFRDGSSEKAYLIDSHAGIASEL